jgi:hypothetical protein
MIKKLIIIIAVLGFVFFGFLNWTPNNSPEDAYAAMCFKTGERVSGMNKICYYDCLGSTVAITISSIELCPLSINN